MGKNLLGTILIAASLLSGLVGHANPVKQQTKPETNSTGCLTFACRADNDLFRLLDDQGLSCGRHDTAEAAVLAAPAGSGVLVLADNYPSNTTSVGRHVLDAAAAKKLRLYLEFPDALPGMQIGAPRDIQWERAVVTSDFFDPALKLSRILTINGCRFSPVQVTNAHLTLARVAGYDTAVFGLPKETFPALFEHPNGNLLIATTKLSQFIAGRYGPTDAWRNVWQGILAWVNPHAEIPALEWRPTVRTAYQRSGKLPSDVESHAVARGVQWYLNAGQIIHPSREKVVEAIADKEDRWTPLEPNPPVGDGSLGVLEGVCSTIDHQGRQIIRYSIRDDCNGETAMVFALAGALQRDPARSNIASNIADFIYFNSPLGKGPRDDPASPSYGLIGWRPTPPSLNVYYGDGAARTLLGTMVTAGLLKSHRWDERLTRCLLANFRTAGKNGFRGNRLDEKSLQANGWKYYSDRDLTNCAPHYEGYLWACYLWAYDQTHYEPFRHRAENAIRTTMDAYPDRWRWANSFQIERARMLLPLAWLVRIDDTPEHRAWLKRITSDLLATQDASGALREEIGDLKLGSHKPALSNEKYGKGETPLIQTNGDPVCDLLYTANFALLGLHEAAAATRDPFYSAAEDKLAKFLCRVQVRSEKHPELDGGWYRAFDYQKWDYWGSNGDWGWGAWCMETGWSQSWITSVLALRQMKTSLWDIAAANKIQEQFTKLQPMMLPSR